MEGDTKAKPEIKAGFKAIWRQLKPFKGQLTVLIVLGIISAIANGFVPYVTGRFIDALIKLSQGMPTNSSIPLWAAFLALWTFVQIVANNVDWVMDRQRRNIDSKIQFNVQTNGFIHLFHLPLTFHKNAHINGVIEKISMASWRISAILGTIIGFVPQFLSISIGFVLAASINLSLALILLLGVAVYISLLIWILRPIAGIDAEAHHSWNDSWDSASEAVHQIESVKQASSEKYESDKVTRDLLGKTFALMSKLNKHWNNISFFQRIVVFLTQLCIFLVSVGLITKGSITVGQLIALNGYALMFFGPFVALGQNWQTIQNGLTTASQVDKIFAEKREVYSPKEAVTLQKLSGSVRFDNISFRYDSEDKDVLTGVSFDVHPGEIIAFVGESGVGKSTAISLISGYYFPYKGAVVIDDMPTEKFNLTNLRSHIAVVPQEVALFNDTIKENIRYGTFDAHDDAIARVAKEAHLEEFIQSLPKKYDTLVGERGVKLSVGQKQRVAIARAILRNPSILILDEPTSALDPQTERIITESLERLMKGRTTFIIAHRLSTVRKADRIFYFEKGTVVESGNHDELMAIQGGKYRNLYEMHIGLH